MHSILSRFWQSIPPARRQPTTGQLRRADFLVLAPCRSVSVRIGRCPTDVVMVFRVEAVRATVVVKCRRFMKSGIESNSDLTNRLRATALATGPTGWRSPVAVSAARLRLACKALPYTFFRNSLTDETPVPCQHQLWVLKRNHRERNHETEYHQ